VGENQINGKSEKGQTAKQKNQGKGKRAKQTVDRKIGKREIGKTEQQKSNAAAFKGMLCVTLLCMQRSG
jgi:hypothetical protein